MTELGEGVSSACLVNTNIEEVETHMIVVCDRAVSGSLGLFYHYSLEYWRADVATVPLSVESDVPDFKDQYDGARQVKAVELLRKTGWSVYEYKVNFVRSDGWEEVSVAISVIHQSATGANIMPIFTGDESTVRTKWDQAVAVAKEYGFGEQQGFNGAFRRWANSVYYIGDNVNNSNTFVRVLVDAIGLTMKEMSGSHPGRLTPLPITTRYSDYPWRAGTTAPTKP